MLLMVLLTGKQWQKSLNRNVRDKPCTLFQAVRTGAKLKETGEYDDIENFIKKNLATAGKLCPVSLEVAGLTVQEMLELGKLQYENVDPVVGIIAIKILVCTIYSKGNGKLFDNIQAI